MCIKQATIFGAGPFIESLRGSSKYTGHKWDVTIKWTCHKKRTKTEEKITFFFCLLFKGGNKSTS